MSVASEGLLLNRQAEVATIVLNHPERANALAPQEFHALAALLSALRDDPAIKAIVLTGQGERAFCAGLNLSDREAIQNDIASDGPTGLGAVLKEAVTLSVPLIGRINGSCVAGGMGLLGACDFAIATSTARFGLPEIRHGIVPFVARAGLEGRAAPDVLDALATSGDLIDAPAAMQAGLVDGLADSADLDSEIEKILKLHTSGASFPRMVRRLSQQRERIRLLAEAEVQARAAACVDSQQF